MDEMMKLWEYLTTHRYNVKWRYLIFSQEPYVYANQIVVYDENSNRLWGAICQTGSYGNEQGLIEIYGDIVCKFECNDVLGWLRADDIINILSKQEEKE